MLVSHPSRVRELKLLAQGGRALRIASHPSRVRELKQVSWHGGRTALPRRTPPGCVN